MKQIKVKLTFTEPILGTASGNNEIHKKYIASKVIEAASKGKEKVNISGNVVDVSDDEAVKMAEEEASASYQDDVEKKEMTVFPRTDDGKPMFWDYQIRGFFKSACGFMRDVTDSYSSKVKAYKKKIDGEVFVAERRIPINYSGDIGVLQRPLRASTMQGDRVALASSEMIPAGATCEFTVIVLNESLANAVKEWLDFGMFNGIGQWRNGGFGRFNWELISEDKRDWQTAEIKQ